MRRPGRRVGTTGPEVPSRDSSLRVSPIQRLDSRIAPGASQGAVVPEVSERKEKKICLSCNVRLPASRVSLSQSFDFAVALVIQRTSGRRAVGDPTKPTRCTRVGEGW